MINFLNDILDLFVCILDFQFLNYFFFPCLALAFLASFPAIVRVLTTWR